LNVVFETNPLVFFYFYSVNTNEFYIQRCLTLAKHGLGSTYPNPMVGCVIVHNHQIIGEGWHVKAGEAHAEVNAINAVKDKSLLKKSTLYVTLEPCSHFGKTPPCSDLIIAEGIPKIVIGTVDPFAKVAGMGIKKLLAAHRTVTVGVCEEACEAINKRFFIFHRLKRPYVILKWAETKHGFIAPLEQKAGDIFWITNAYAQQLVHKWRSEEQAILVGTQTAFKDNPSLNVRHWHGQNPTRIVIDQSLKLPQDLALFNKSQPTIVFHDEALSKTDESNLSFKGIDFKHNSPEVILQHLHASGLQSVIIEGGAQTLQSFIDAKLWDEARVFTGQNEIEKGIQGPRLQQEPSYTEDIEGDKLNYYYND
jgi:diaminohydroxyphosphoribosylaminopyrimidine deaminase/5-amino-6-(5-phosphoribosylamino)uracil reductase